MAVPNFLCVGAQKAGTTTLYEILKQHPDIFLPQQVKETKFFVYEEKFQKGLAFYSQKILYPIESLFPVFNKIVFKNQEEHILFPEKFFKPVYLFCI